MTEQAETSVPAPAGLGGLDGYPHTWAGQFPTTSLELEPSATPAIGEFAGALAELALTVKREGSHSDERALTVIAETAAAIIPGVDQAAVITPGPTEHHAQVKATHGELPDLIVALENETGQGPFTEALTQQVAVRSADTSQEHRWPLFTSGINRWPVASVLCTPLTVQGKLFGSLALVATQPGAIDEHTEMLAAVFAAHAAVALINVQDLGNLRAMAASRDLIGQAKGILMARNNTTADEAFAALVHASQHSNRKLRDICSYLITHGSIDSLGSV